MFRLTLVMLNKLRCHANMPRPLLIYSQSDFFIQVVDINSQTEWWTVLIQIRWLLQKPTDLDLHCLQRQGISRFRRTRVKYVITLSAAMFLPGPASEMSKGSCLRSPTVRLIRSLLSMKCCHPPMIFTFLESTTLGRYGLPEINRK